MNDQVSAKASAGKKTYRPVTARYLKYAIGEILLVMAGILLALQVNNWNENRKQNNLEQNYLLALKVEFQENLESLDKLIIRNDKNRKNALELSKYTGPDTPELTEAEFANLIVELVVTELEFRPGSGVINEIINSGKLNIFQSAELKKELASLDGLLLKVRFQEQEHGNSRNNLVQMLEGDDISMRKLTFDAYGEVYGLKQSKFLDSNIHLLKSKEFENHLSVFIYTSGFMKDNYYSKLREQINRIINIIDK